MKLKKHTPDWEVERPIVLRKYRDWLGIVDGDDRYVLEPSSPIMEEEAAAATPLRRSKRRCSSVISPIKAADPNTTVVQKPSRRNKKRVRFSEPTPRLAGNSNNTTGLTPAIGRSSLTASTPRRSVSTPIPAASSPSGNAYSSTYQFTPFKAQLDPRLRRRISRNGLSAEMNSYETERKDKARLEREVREKDEELQRLREELEKSKSRSKSGSNDSSLVHDVHDNLASSQQHVDSVEAELEVLRQSFNAIDDDDDAFAAAATDDDMPIVDWSAVQTGTSGPRSTGGDTIRIHEDSPDRPAQTQAMQNDVHLLGMALELESAKKEKRRLFQEVRRHVDAPGTTLNFADSPSASLNQQLHASNDSLASLPSPPKDFYHNLSKTLKAATARAEQAEEALTALETEVAALGFAGHNGSARVASIALHFREARLQLERAMPGETTAGLTAHAQLLPDVLGKLQGLLARIREREAELGSLREQHRSLKGNFEHAIVTAETAARRNGELEAAVDTAAEEMLHARMRANALEKERDAKERDVQRLVAALEKYRADVARLEGLVSDMERENSAAAATQEQVSDLEAKAAAETQGRRKAEASAVERLARIQELEAALAEAHTEARNVESQLSALQRSTTATAEEHAQQLGGLNARMSGLSTALAGAQAEVERLRLVKARLEARLRDEVRHGQDAVEAIQHEMERALGKASERRKGYVRGAKVRVANSEIEGEDAAGSSCGEGPMTPASLVRFVDVERERDEDDEDEAGEGEQHVEGRVEIGRGKRRSFSRSGGLRGLGFTEKRRGGRRRYDSGIGMNDSSSIGAGLSEDELEQAWEESDGEEVGVLTPDLSSDIGVDVEMEMDFETGLGVHVG